MFGQSGPLLDPTSVSVADHVESCEHCQAVTWAGVAACGCEFGLHAVNEDRTRDMAVDPSCEIS